MEMEQRQEEIRRKIENLPALNAVVLETIRRSGCPDCSVKDIAELTSSDAFLSARVLRMVNPSYYGLPQRVETISVAVPLLGIRKIRRMVMGISTYDIMSEDLSGYGHEEGALWAHSLAVAVASEHICEMLSYKKIEELRLVALLHDIGKIVLSSLLLEILDDSERLVLKEGGIAALNIEREACEIDHAETGAMIVERWNLSPRFAEIIRHHHKPEDAPNLPKASSIVCLADCIATWLLKADDRVVEALKIGENATEILRLTTNDILQEIVEINRKIRDELDFWMKYEKNQCAVEGFLGR